MNDRGPTLLAPDGAPFSQLTSPREQPSETGDRRLHGVIPPVVTPLTPDLDLDRAGLRRVVERLIAAGVDGVFALGSTGEVAFATPRQREQILTEVIDVVAGRVPVIAGVVDTQTARVLEHVEVATDLGVDAVVATAPFYAVTPPPQVRRHFELIAATSPVPVYAYDIPVCVQSKLDPDMLVDLGRRGIIAGVKDSSGDDVTFRRLALKNAEAGSPLALFTGHEFVVDGAYLSGAHGSVPGLGNVDPGGYVRMHAAALAGDWDAVRREQDRLARLMEICLAPTSMSGWGAGVGAFKTALQLLGVIDGNAVPWPFEALAGDDVDAIRNILRQAGLLGAA